MRRPYQHSAGIVSLSVNKPDPKILQDFLVLKFALSRRAAKAAIDGRSVWVNRKCVWIAHHTLHTGDTVEVPRAVVSAAKRQPGSDRAKKGEDGVPIAQGLSAARHIRVLLETPDYVVAVWTGNCDGEGRPLMTGVGYAAPVMFDLFNLLPPTRWFEMPENDLHPVATCPLSGHPLSDVCLQGHPDMKPDTVLVPFAPASPVNCPYHRIVHLNPEGTLQVNSDCCPIDAIRNVSWFVLPPAQEWYYMRSHSDYRRLPPLHPTLRGAAGSGLIEIIYPQAGMIVASPVDLDSRSRGVIFSAAHSDPSAVIYWNMDDTFLGVTSKGEHKIKVVPSKGPHRLVLTDANGNTASVRFEGR